MIEESCTRGEVLRTARKCNALSVIVQSAFVFPCLISNAIADQQSPHSPVVPKRIVELFEPGVVSLSQYAMEGAVVSYRLFKPRSMESRQWPIIVWLHGAGESGRDNVSQLRHLQNIFEHPGDPERYEFALLAVQCPSRDTGWLMPLEYEGDSAVDFKPDMLVCVREALDSCIEKYPIDKERIYLAGVSSGGAACWEMGMRYPKLFAAMSTMSCSAGDYSRLDQVVHLPIWAFNPIGDSPEPARRTIKVLESLGGICHLTEVPGASHDSWTPAIARYDVVPWLLSQRLHSDGSPSPGTLVTYSAQWKVFGSYVWPEIWPRLIPFIPIAILIALYRRERGKERSKDAEVAAEEF